jgi:hypothetical protein
MASIFCPLDRIKRDLRSFLSDETIKVRKGGHKPFLGEERRS